MDVPLPGMGQNLLLLLLIIISYHIILYCIILLLGNNNTLTNLTKTYQNQLWSQWLPYDTRNKHEF